VATEVMRMQASGPDWLAFRAQMPVVQHWAFLDHAAVAPVTAGARQALCDWAQAIADHGVVAEAAWLQRVEEARGLAGRLLEADPEDIAFIKNTSEGVGLIAEGFPWQPGDNVVSVADEYPANVFPWRNLARRGVELRLVPSRQGRVLLDDLRAAIDRRTRLLTLSFVEFATGFRNDLDAVGQLCQEQGLALFVDAIQGLGVLPLSVARTPIDFLAADGHKWLLGPEGAGILYVRRAWIERLQPIGIGWNSVLDSFRFDNQSFHLKPHAGRYESGALNLGGIAALGASMRLLLQQGIEAIACRVQQLTDYFCAQVARLGWTIYSSRRPGEWSGIVSVLLPAGVDGSALVARCRQAGVVVSRRAGRLRVSPHAYNTEDDLDRLLEVLRDAGG
jgi:cysteine desulfurase/selenocysteine lyase